MLRRIAMMGLVVMVIAPACGDGETASTTPTSSTSTAVTSTTAAPPVRSIEVVSLTGEADTSVAAGEALASGDSITTGTDGIVVLETEDGTTIVVMEDTAVTVTGLSWSDGAAHTILSLDSGRVAAVRATELPDGGLFEIQAPGFTAGLSGSALGVVYQEDVARVDASCLFGDCYVTASGDTTALAGDEWIDPSDGVATKAAFNAEQRRVWARALEAIRAAGGSVESCACDGRSLLCEGTVEVPYFPACPDDTECSCEGPDLICEDGREFTDDQQCMADMTAITDLIVENFTATYDCIDARARYKVFDTRPEATVRLRPYDNEASSCEDILPWFPVTYSIPGPNADGSLTGSSVYASGHESDFVIIDAPGEGQQGAIGPRFGGSFIVYGKTHSSPGRHSTVSGEKTDAVMTKSGTETISILGQTVRAVVYRGSYTGWDVWETNDGSIRSRLEFSGTVTVWFDAVTGLELRSREEGFYTGCSNCDGSFVGMRERLEIVELVGTNQSLNPGS